MKPASWAADQIHTRTEIRFSWRDRLKILLNGKAIVIVDTDCENLPGRVHSWSRTYTPRLWPSRRTGGGYGEVADLPIESLSKQTA